MKKILAMLLTLALMASLAACGGSRTGNQEQDYILSLLEEGDYDTFGGMVFDAYGFIPEDGSQFEIDIPPLHIQVRDIQDHRIERAIVTLTKEEPEEEEE